MQRYSKFCCHLNALGRRNLAPAIFDITGKSDGGAKTSRQFRCWYIIECHVVNIPKSKQKDKDKNIPNDKLFC